MQSWVGCLAWLQAALPSEPLKALCQCPAASGALKRQVDDAGSPGLLQCLQSKILRLILETPKTVWLRRCRAFRRGPFMITGLVPGGFFADLKPLSRRLSPSSMSVKPITGPSFFDMAA